MHDFEEFHNEANNISALNNQLKGLNNWLENRVSQLKKETTDLKIDFTKHILLWYNQSIETEKQSTEILEKMQKCELTWLKEDDL